MKARWSIRFIDEYGFECQVTLADESEAALAHRAAAFIDKILYANYRPCLSRPASHDGEGVDLETPMRRCDELRNGELCDQLVTAREGRYGPFWSCPSYQQHDRRPSRY